MQRKFVFFNNLNLLMANSDLALAYAALILVDAKKELTQANLDTLVTKVRYHIFYNSKAGF